MNGSHLAVCRSAVTSVMFSRNCLSHFLLLPRRRSWFYLRFLPGRAKCLCAKGYLDNLRTGDMSSFSNDTKKPVLGIAWPIVRQGVYSCRHVWVLFTLIGWIHMKTTSLLSSENYHSTESMNVPNQQGVFACRTINLHIYELTRLQLSKNTLCEVRNDLRNSVEVLHLKRMQSGYIGRYSLSLGRGEYRPMSCRKIYEKVHRKGENVR